MLLPLSDGSWKVFLLATLVKLMLLPSYRSTDFEVHRNWLAITSSLPLREWYTEATSQWTLDYPPFFAWFECLLGHFARLFDDQMLVVANLDYASTATVLFQRLSVIVTDFVLFVGVQQYVKCFRGDKDLYKGFIISVFVLLNAGLLIVDHVHFQYNGILSGVLLLSIAKMRQGRDLYGAILFAVLLNMKHIYLYLAPAYFVYLLRHYCFRDAVTGATSSSVSPSTPSASSSTAQPAPADAKRFSLSHFLLLGASVALVFAASFGPFILSGQLGQVLSRLFPFRRGLTHAYWAPNFWALYNAADKLLAFGLKVAAKASVSPVNATLVSTSSGLVGDVSHTVLPSISPSTTFLLTLICMLPILYKLWVQPTFTVFVRAIVVCAYSSFLFGWHVHEKAVLLILLPMSLLAVQNANDGKWFLLLSCSGLYSLLPLLFQPNELFVKHLLVLAYLLFVYTSLRVVFRGFSVSKSDACKMPFRLSIPEKVYFFGFIGMTLFVDAICPLFLVQKYAFLPLLVTSLYCALGVLYTFVRFYAAC